MKAVVFRNLNDILSLTLLTLMVIALVAGQANLLPDAAGSDDFDAQITSIRHDRE